jgi:hypothetical protein
MDIEIRTVPQEKQRYDTLGDWFIIVSMIDGSRRLGVTVTNMNNEDSEFAIAVHEMVEAYLCLKRGISGKEVDKFDMEFKGEGEPGDDPEAPYYKEHQFAMKIERLIVEELGIDWEEHLKNTE